MFCWIFFRAPNLLVAFEFFKTIFSPGLFSFPNIKLDNADLLKFAHLMLAVFLLVIFEWMSRRTNSSVHFFDKIRISFLRRSLYVILIFMIYYFKGLPVEFIYFAF
jgi:hypothetical protein